jgi:hypothetical protein
MDDQALVLRKELEKTLQTAAELKVRLDRAEGKIRGVPHYSAIEEAAHAVGQELSRMVQCMHMNEVLADYAPVARCPTCRTQCKLQPQKRRVLSGDGRLELQELVAHCPCCRRDFFPTTGADGV